MWLTASSPITGRTSKVRLWRTLVEPFGVGDVLADEPVTTAGGGPADSSNCPTAILWILRGEGMLRGKRDAHSRYTLPAGAKHSQNDAAG